MTSASTQAICSIDEEIPLLIKQSSFLCQHKKLSGILYTQTYRHLQVYPNLPYHIASYVRQGLKSTPLFEQFAETGMLSYADEEKEVVETVLPVKATEKEGVVEPEDETKVEDNTYVNESRSVIKR